MIFQLLYDFFLIFSVTLLKLVSFSIRNLFFETRHKNKLSPKKIIPNPLFELKYSVLEKNGAKCIQTMNNDVFGT